ncbi:FAD dependent oxidoreductase [Aspergillus granulosus]|uniref:FAD dependent oxidoreductase n=1 Tax=Aspergillus granulosus TaxID=176169 RepID=A0ABR4H313_9EURO
MTSSAQPVGFIQLTNDEAEYYKDLPVVDNMTTGVFISPPTSDTHLLKIAHHGHSFENQVRTEKGRVFSAPARDTNNALPSYIPEDADKALREGLRQFVPGVSERPWVRRQLCWYTETPKGNFVVDNHDRIESLFLATGGSGHAFKILPVIGAYIVDCFEDKASRNYKISGD